MDITKPDADLSKLTPDCKMRVQNMLNLAAKKGLKVRVFEAYRPKERQAWLYGQGRTKAQCLAAFVNPKYSRAGNVVTWTMTSQHILGKAVDMVFVDTKGNPTWSGNWDALIKCGEAAGLQNLRPREMSHFQLA